MEKQAAGKMRKCMVLTHVNGADQKGVAYDEVDSALKDVRPLKLQFVVSEAALEADDEAEAAKEAAAAAAEQERERKEVAEKEERERRRSARETRKEAADK
jgi:hypothetical protein